MSRRSWIVAPLAAVLTAPLLALLPTTPAYAANPVTPGNYRGLGFDQCEAPSQSAMSTWIRKSPFRAAGIYISGDSRACQRQTHLTATWVRNQLAAGWHLLPITLGPQAWCTTRERYLRQVRINPSSTGTYSRARSQGAAEADKAVATAQRLGIVRGSTIFYDLEAFDHRRSTSCTTSALWFVTAWTRRLHARGYASGFYSSAASGIRMLDDARVRPGSPHTMPDQIWIADWNNKADTKSSYIRSDGWLPYRRIHQYRGGRPETWGGVTINIDRNYLDLRTPRIPGASAPAPAPKPTPKPTPTTVKPRYTGTSMADPKCSPTTINRSSYRQTGPGRPAALVPLQCLLKQQGLYRYQVTGSWNYRTWLALRAFQTRVGHPLTGYASRSDWISLITAGGSGATTRVGSTGPDVIRLKRALNAAGSAALPINGTFWASTRPAVMAYQKQVGVPATGVVASQTWAALKAGRW